MCHDLVSFELVILRYETHPHGPHRPNAVVMNSKSLEQAKTLVNASYVKQGEQALNGRRKLVGGDRTVCTGCWCCAVLTNYSLRCSVCTLLDILLNRTVYTVIVCLYSQHYYRYIHLWWHGAFQCGVSSLILLVSKRCCLIGAFYCIHSVG